MSTDKGGHRGRRHRRKLQIAKRAAPGAAPGTLVADPEAAPTRVSALSYNAEGLHEQTSCKPADIARLRRPGHVLWVNIDGLADIALIEEVGRVFGLHQLSLEDVVNVHQRPKTETFDDHSFVIVRMLHRDGWPERGIETEQISLFIGEGFLLTFQEQPGDCFDPVRDRLRRGKGRLRQMGADYLAYALIDAVIDGYFPALEEIGEAVETLEDEVIAQPEPDQVDRLHRIKRELLTLRRAIWPTREMVNALIRDDSAHIGQTTRLYLRDCYDHAIQLMDIVETYREIAASLLDVYLSSLSARMNEIMKVLTIIATIFIPLSFLAGLWGMNFDTASPWNMPELKWAIGYPVALVVMLAVGVGLLAWFWRKGWIGGRKQK
ncbi:MAG: magnesium/cobalt transporter CorA [Alphaproteobacteria bacterium]